MTEDVIKVCSRLGVAVYLRSPRTGRVWVIQPSTASTTGQLRGFPSPIHGCTGYLTHKQVQWHLKNKSENFTTTLYEQPPV